MLHRVAIVSAAIVLTGAAALVAWSPVPVEEDPLVRMPGTQPADGVTLEDPGRCLNCHAGYNSAVEPGFNWKGSMMAHAARDFLFYACMTVAGQDSIWATGRPNAVDLCERCHFPKGWLEGRSDPPNASAMTGADFDGVQCDLCHRMYDPHYQDTFDGVREGGDWQTYWDETGASDTPSLAAAHTTLLADQTEAQTVHYFDGAPFYASHRPASTAWTEAASGQMFVAATGDKRASFADAAARHQMLYSRFHKSRYLCATCHDVSNPVLANLGDDGLGHLPTEVQSAFSYAHVERTFSEFMLSDYGRQGGAPGKGPFAPGSFETSLPGDWIARCQDCHMRDVSGVGCDKRGVPNRPSESVEHPNSGQPLHDLTGGNAWVSRVLASAVPGSPNHDPVNESLLGQGPQVLTLDLAAGEGIDPVALIAGSDRAIQQLRLAATIDNLTYDAAAGRVAFRLQNNTGHKLPSGFPEGRRMFVTVRGYSNGQVAWQVNPYDDAAGTLKGLPYASSPPLEAGESYVDELVYEMHPSSDLTGEESTFHFALATGRAKDNRIPPKGFRIAEAAARLADPVWHGASAPGYFTTAEYAGGYDDIAVDVPAGASGVEVVVSYQTTSREYVEFLRDEINGTASTLALDPATGTNPAGGTETYVVQTDSFFTQLRAWGDTLWQLWDHNRTLPGAAPVVMASATTGTVGGGCTSPRPTLLAATPGHSEVTLGWSDEHSGDGRVTGYLVSYDQGGKYQLIAATGAVVSYLDAGLTNGQQYCYVVQSRTDGCDSEISNTLCATPSSGATTEVGASSVAAGRYETTGSGRNKVTVFAAATSFNAGETVVLRATVEDAAGVPVMGARVSLAITGPEGAAVDTGWSDADGIADGSWSTSAPKGNRPGTAPGAYTVTVTDVTGTGLVWDGQPVAATFAIQ